jgi:NADPH:quinone reductase-like Zn-dependent oxidoreductase
MISAAICREKIKSLDPENESIKTIHIEEIPITVGLLETDDIKFPDHSDKYKDHVLVKKRAFSNNYRDKAILLNTAMRLSKPEGTGVGRDLFSFTGSEFVGEVVEIGEQVTGFRIGDRVIPNAAYPHSQDAAIPTGLPTSFASMRYDIFHQAQLVVIPDEMPDEVAAAFTIGGHTIYGMMRRLQLKKNSDVLITSAKSNTSLMAINALRHRDVNIYAMSSTSKFEKELLEMGVKELVTMAGDTENFMENDRMGEIVRKINGFDAVIDPFADLHVGKITRVMSFNSTYVTCGVYQQYSHIIGKPFHFKGDSPSTLFSNCIARNISLVGHCLGSKEDLMQAVDDYKKNKFDVVIDSVFSGNRLSDFFVRTYNDPNRFGKVVYKYDAEG